MAHYKVTFPSGETDTTEAPTKVQALEIIHGNHGLLPPGTRVEEIEVGREVNEPDADKETK